ncbi:hypothetical protein BDV93DRAFT_238673 [Ceratobasidium sp. AG-I]|nr:hypothetical protein BDV93DRAFT_238673 [Ceratobasidium sp. AG-I]
MDVSPLLVSFEVYIVHLYLIFPHRPLFRFWSQRRRSARHPQRRQMSVRLPP